MWSAAHAWSELFVMNLSWSTDDYTGNRPVMSVIGVGRSLLGEKCRLTLVILQMNAWHVGPKNLPPDMQANERYCGHLLGRQRVNRRMDIARMIVIIVMSHGRHDISHHRLFECLFNYLLMSTTKKISKVRVFGVICYYGQLVLCIFTYPPSHIFV